MLSRRRCCCGKATGPKCGWICNPENNRFPAPPRLYFTDSIFGEFVLENYGPSPNFPISAPTTQDGDPWPPEMPFPCRYWACKRVTVPAGGWLSGDFYALAVISADNTWLTSWTFRYLFGPSEYESQGPCRGIRQPVDLDSWSDTPPCEPTRSMPIGTARQFLPWLAHRVAIGPTGSVALRVLDRRLECSADEESPYEFDGLWETTSNWTPVPSNVSIDNSPYWWYGGSDCWDPLDPPRIEVTYTLSV